MMLDGIKPQYRHAIILFIGALLTFATNKLNVVPADYRPFASATLTIITLVWTPLTKQYGVGSGD